MNKEEFLHDEISSLNEARLLEGKLPLALAEDQTKQLSLLCGRLVRLVELDYDDLFCSVDYREDEVKRIIGDANRIINGKAFSTFLLNPALADGVAALINALLRGIENGDLEPNDEETLNEWQRKTSHLDLIAILSVDNQTGSFSLLFRDAAAYPHGLLNPGYLRPREEN